MALVLKDRVQETTTTTGTGTITLAGAVTGFQSFSVIGNGNTTYYTISGGSEWEVGIGTYTSSGTTLSRDTILESSNSGSAVNFSAGSKAVFCTYPAERSMYVDGTTITPATTATLPVASGGTGATTLTSNAVILGNTTSAVQFVSPGTSGNVLTSDGSTWASTAPVPGAQDFELVTDFSFTGQTYSSFDVTGLTTTNGWYVMVGRIFFSGDGEAMTLRWRASTDGGSSFYSSAGNYVRNGSGNSGPELMTQINRSLNTNPGEVCFNYFFYQPSAANNSDCFTMNGMATGFYVNSGGGSGQTVLTTGNTLAASTSAVNAFRFDRTTGTATYTSGFIKIYKLAMS